MAFIETKFSSLIHLLDEQIGDFVLVSWVFRRTLFNAIQNARWSIRLSKSPKTFSSLFSKKKDREHYRALMCKCAGYLDIHSLKCLLGSIIKTGWLMVSLKLRCWKEEHEAIIPDCPQNTPPLNSKYCFRPVEIWFLSNLFAFKIPRDVRVASIVFHALQTDNNDIFQSKNHAIRCTLA